MCERTDMSSPGGKNSNPSEQARLEAELAQARAEVRAAELKAKVLALEAKLQRQEPAQAQTLEADLPLKKVPRAAPRSPAKLAAKTATAKSKAAPARPAAAVAVATKPSTDDPPPWQSTKPAATTSTPVTTSPDAQPPPARPRAKDTSAAEAATAVVVSQPVHDDNDDSADDAEDEKRRRRTIGLLASLAASQSWVWSMAVHLAALIFLVLIYLDTPDVEDLLPLVAHIDDEQMDVLEEIREEELEFDEIEGLAFDIEDPGMADFGQPELPDEMSEMSLEHVSSTITEIGALFGESGKGWATAGTGSGGAEFYGVKTRGNKFVFVVDNSLSMNGGRFESACYELFYSVTKMSPDQQFYVLFFSDTAYPLYYPTPAQGMVPADRTNKDLLARWLPTVQLVLRTDARKAVETALAMKPSGIYILTDGAFTDDTSQMLLQMPKGRTTIHTVGMEIQGRHEETLKKIAEHHNGSYRHVRVDPQIRLKAQRIPRKRNSKPGPVWGIALGQPKAKRIRPQQPNRPNQPGKKPGNQPRKGAGKGPNKKPAKKN